MLAGAILWLGLLVLLALLFVVTVRRMSVLIARTRDLERVQRSVDSLDRRLAAATEPLVTRLDEIRRQAGDPQALARDLGASAAMIQELAAETRALRVPAVLAIQAAVMVRETERAVRAVELVEHGLGALLAARGSRVLEAQTSLKRGALNLRHAREAFGRAAAEVAALRPADVARRPGAAIASAPTAEAASGGGVEQDADGPFEPRM